MDRAQDLAGGQSRAAAGLERAGVAIRLAGAIAHQIVPVDERGWLLVQLPARPQQLSGRADIGVRLGIIVELPAREGAVLALRLVEDRDVRCDPAMLDQPVEHGCGAICGIGDEAFGVQIEPRHGAVDHPACRTGFCLSDGTAGLDIDDHRIVGVNQVVCRIGEEGMAPIGCGPLRGGVGIGCELGRHLAGRPESRVVEDRQILAHRPGSRLRINGIHVPFGLRCRVLLGGLGLDHAGVDRKPLAAHQALGDAARDHTLEQVPEQVAVAEPPMPVLRKRRVIRHRIRQVEPAEPAIGQVQMNLFAEPPLGPDAHAIADQQHPDHQLRIDRGPARRAVERGEMRADA